MLIKNIRIIDPLTDTDQIGDILIVGDKIAEVNYHDETNCAGSVQAAGQDFEIIDGTGLCAAPGLMDTHVHFRDPGQTHKEDIFTGAAAAARGGFTRVVCMANTTPSVDTPEVLRKNLEKGEKTGITILQAGALTKGLKGRELTDMEALAEAGACAVTDDGIPLKNAPLLLEGMKRAAMLNRPVSLHEEDPAFVPGPGVNEGWVSRKLGYPGALSLAEEIMVASDCMLALESGCRVIIQHVSSARSVELIRHARRMGADVHGEATPHHFSLTEEAVLKYGTNARMNPPLRTEEDRQAVAEGIADGTLDMIVTDHAPHTAEEKARPLPEAPSGIIGLETSLALGIRFLVETRRLSLVDLIRRMSTQPALVYGLSPAAIHPGRRADLVIFDEKGIWIADHFVSKASNSPFSGWKLPGRICYTISGGRIVYGG